MTKYGFSELVIKVDASEGGALQDMSAYVQTFNGWDIEAVLEEITAAGDAAEAWAKVGLKRGGEVVLGGYYDDTATTGPNAVFNAPGETRSLEITWGGTKKTSAEAIIRRYQRTSAKGELTKYEVTLQVTGVVTEA